MVTHDPLPDVLADEMQLTQLFQNLVGNAIKYHEHGASRRSTSPSARQRRRKKWLFSVKDNGLGIEPQYFERIFGMFQRLHKREEFAGTGIGLAICKKIVERHGGNISVESQPGQGSTFRFALTGSDGANREAIGGHGMPIEVLLVEDSPGDVRLTQEAFRDANPSDPCTSPPTAWRPWRFSTVTGAHDACSPPGSHPAGPEPPENGRPRGSGADQGG